MWRKPMSTVMTKSDYGRATDQIYGLIAWITLGIFLIVVGLLVYALVRYRERGPGELPRQIRGHSLLEIGWTIAPALVLLVIAIPPIQTIFRTPPAADPAATEGAAVFAKSACVGCHTVRGVSAGVVGPDLTHFGSRRTVAAGLLPNTPANVLAWIQDPPAVKPGVKMPALGLSQDEARAVAGYLASLK